MCEKTNEFISDMTEPGSSSDCCGASIVMGDICAECKEHCEPVDDGEDYQDDDAWSGGFPSCARRCAVPARHARKTVSAVRGPWTNLLE